MKRISLGIIVLLLFSVAAQAAGLRIGSWNLKHLGWNNAKNLAAIAQVMGRFDLIAVQEVMRPEHLQPLVTALEKQTGYQWKVISSRAMGSGRYREGYAFFWRPGRVQLAGGAVLYIDPGDKFLREPFSAVFKPADDSIPAFVAATVHIKYGDNRQDRTPEIRALASYWQWLQESFDGKPIILMGDFNLALSDRAWRPLRELAKPYVSRRTTLSKTDGQFASSYDHFWASPSLPVTSALRVPAPEMLGVTHDTAYKYISDHVPIGLTLGDAKIDVSPVADPAIQDRRKPSKAATVLRKCIDLNRAALARLTQLSHVGPARAKAIIAGRPWRSIGELTRIPGLTAKRVADIGNGRQVCALSQ